MRDILHAKDMVDLYYTALEHTDQVCGAAYNVGGGIQQSLSLLELFDLLNELLGIRLRYTQLNYRLRRNLSDGRTIECFSSKQ